MSKPSITQTPEDRGFQLELDIERYRELRRKLQTARPGPTAIRLLDRMDEIVAAQDDPEAFLLRARGW